MGESDTAISEPNRTSVCKITAVLPITRPQRVLEMAKQIAALDVEGIDLELLIILDNKNVRLRDTELAFRKVCNYPMEVFHTKNSLPGEFNVYARRGRIKDVMNIAREKISKNADYVFILEDDTNIEFFYLKTLLNTFKSDSKSIGVVSGVQSGRHGIKHIGVWHTDNIENPTRLYSAAFKDSISIEEADAAGLYCSLVSASLFRNTEFRTDFFGCDINFGLDIKKQGYKVLIDWSLRCGHAIKDKVLEVDQNCSQALFLLENEHWKLVKEYPASI